MSRCRPPALRNTALLATALSLLGFATLSAPVIAAEAPADGAAAGSEGGSEEEVVDAEFSEVDEDAKN